MRLRLPLCLALAAVAGLVTLTLHGQAQEETATLYVSGLTVGKKQTALVRIHNASPSAADIISVEYRIRHTDAGQTLFLAPAGAPVRSGETLELDLGAIVNAHRASIDLGEFEGPVQFVAFGTGGVFRSFGPETMVVEAQQKEGRATFAPVVEWR